MEAISALCVSTASCGAAAIGCAYGRVDLATGLAREGTDDDSTILPQLPQLPQFPRSTQSQGLRRPQSLTVPPSAPLWPALHDAAAHNHSNTTDVPDTLSNTDPDVTGALENLPSVGSIGRASWTRRMSAIPQSQDGSHLSSPGPSSPSHFSNVPFFPQPVTPRNKLVKRSTSLRVLHSGLDSSPLSLTQNSTFRRPVTSYQRSEQLRLHQLQKDLENVDAGHSLQNELRPTTPSRLSEIPALSADHSGFPWQPYFFVQSIRLVRDFSRGSATGKLSGTIDNVPCIRTLPRSIPALVPASIVSKPTFISSSSAPRFLVRATNEPGSDQVESSPLRNESQKLPKTRHSFSLGDIMSTPPSARKLRRGDTVRKSKVSEPSAARRVISAPLQDSQVRSERDQIHEQSHPNLSASWQNNCGHHIAKSSSRVSSSPLPPLQRLSAFEIDLPTEGLSHPPSPDPYFPSSPPASSQSPSDALDRAGYSSIRFKPRRTSRIASDRASTAFSSENEYSRVFSTDGDDVDYRSETVYDSIRTDATSSSHSGAKIHRADSVFGGTSPEPTAGTALPIHDRTANIVIPTSKVHDVRIAEEDEMGTPIRVQNVREAETPTPAPRVFHLTPPTANSHTLTGQSKAPSIDDVAEETEVEDFWSVAEANHDRNSFEEAKSVAVSDAGLANFTDSTQNEQHRGNNAAVYPSDLSVSSRDVLPAFSTERGSRSGRRIPPGLHLRSQSVPLPAENNGHRFNNAARLDAWVLGGKGVSEDWDNDFEFDDPGAVPADDSKSTNTEIGPDFAGVLVPSSILDRQASVHGQFGQVKKLTQLVEELRDLRQAAEKFGLVQGQSSELWREAEGIIDLATLDDDEGDLLQPNSPQSSSIDFDAFEDDSALLRPLAPTSLNIDAPQDQSTSTDTSILSSSPFGSRHSTPHTRPRKESVAKAKHVLENIHQHRSLQSPGIVPEEGSPRKLPFDTTSLRDLVTRAGVVTRALREIVRRAEDPDHTSNPEYIPRTPPEPAFSQIFHPSATPPSSRRSPRSARSRGSGSVLSGSPGTNETDRNGHLPIMSVV